MPNTSLSGDPHTTDWFISLVHFIKNVIQLRNVEALMKQQEKVMIQEPLTQDNISTRTCSLY